MESMGKKERGRCKGKVRKMSLDGVALKTFKEIMSSG